MPVNRPGKLSGPVVTGSFEKQAPGAITARFLRYSARELIFSKPIKLKHTEDRISANLPKEIVYQRKLQLKRLVEGRKASKIAFFTRAEPDKLFIDGVLNPI